MFDPEFDPYDTLMQHDQLIMGAHKNILAITDILQERSDYLIELSHQHNLLVERCNRQQQLIEHLHNRLQLLEIARQYASK